MIELLYWEGCPSYPRALDRLTEELRNQQLNPALLKVIEIKTQQDAERERFVGSPTIRIDGADVIEPSEQHYGLECRIYYRRDGRTSPLPDPDDIKEALERYASKSK